MVQSCKLNALSDIIFLKNKNVKYRESLTVKRADFQTNNMSLNALYFYYMNGT